MKRSWRVLITMLVLTLPFAAGLLITYEKIPYDWISMMEIQSSHRAMENPLPLPENSVPVQGAVSVRGMGAPENPVEADEESIRKGKELYDLHCALCHGDQGKGQSMVAAFLQDPKPADLTTNQLVMENDGALFLTISQGVEDTMPALRQNMSVKERWHVVNYIQSWWK